MTGITLLETQAPRSPATTQGRAPSPARAAASTATPSRLSCSCRPRPGSARRRSSSSGSASGPAPAWLSLDRRDSDPSVFWTYVDRRAAQGRTRRSAPKRSLTLQSTPGALEAVVASLAQRPRRRSTDDVVLVLDDYHVIESARRARVDAVPRSSTCPTQLHLVVASRADPPWPLAGLRARGELARGPGRRPALHRRRGRGLPQRRHGPRPRPTATSTPSKAGPKAGSPRCSSPPSRSRAGTTRRRSSPSSPATTGSSSTTSSTRCSTASPTTSGRSSSRPRS